MAGRTKLMSDYEAQIAIENFVNNLTDDTDWEENEEKTSSDGK